MQRWARPLQRLPWWAALVAGIGCVVAGLALTARPFSSLAALIIAVAATALVTGVSDVIMALGHRSESGREGERRMRWAHLLPGLGWIVLALAIVSWPGLSIRGLVLLVGVSMILGGGVRVVVGWYGNHDGRVIDTLSGLASVVFGALALSWPDVTVLVVALLVGPRTILFGCHQIAIALRRRTVDTGHAILRVRAGRRRWAHGLRVAGAALSLLLALGMLALSAWFHGSAPVVDAFYTAPAQVPSTPGVLLRSEPFTREVPTDARGWRILYTTTRDDATPVVASAIVVAPRGPADGAPRPVVAWAHGTTGVARGCAPSLLEQPFSSGALPPLESVLTDGWVLVATDYVGLGTAGMHPYLIGEGEARSVLDAVRAAHQLPDLTLAAQTVVWGHSQGGHAALWTGALAPTYAPDVTLNGVVAMAPASDLAGLLGQIDQNIFLPTLFSYAIAAYSAIYPDVDLSTYVRPGAQVFVRETARRCLSEPSLLFSVLGSLPFDGIIAARDPLNGPLGERLRENIPTGLIDAPVFIAQGAVDSLILPTMQAGYVAERCAAGQIIDYRTYAGRDHVPLVEADSPLIPDLIDWTRARFNGDAAPTGCLTSER